MDSRGRLLPFVLDYYELSVLRAILVPTIAPFADSAVHHPFPEAIRLPQSRFAAARALSNRSGVSGKRHHAR